MQQIAGGSKRSACPSTGSVLPSTKSMLSRATLLQRLGRPADFDPNGEVSDGDLLVDYCEALVAAVPDPAKKSA